MNDPHLAASWIDTLLRVGLIHAAVEGRLGQWLLQIQPDEPVHLLQHPDDVLDLVAHFQHHLGPAGGESR